MNEVQVGSVTHYFNRISVAVLELDGELEIGDVVHIVGRITDFVMRVASMEIDHQKVQTVSPGQDVALQVDEYVRAGDTIFKVLPE